MVHCFGTWAEQRDYFFDTDDAMRLLQIREWLSGKNWYDLLQTRINGSEGLHSHWSRILDAPIGGFIFVAKLFFEPLTAELVASFAWSGTMFMSVLSICAVCGRKLSRSQGFFLATLMSVLNMPGMTQFVPGRIDHHSLQIVLVMIGYSTFVFVEKIKWGGIILGFVSAMSLGIGTEALPLFVVMGLLVCFEWVFSKQNGDKIGAYGISLALSIVFFHLALKGFNFNVHCDALSINYTTSIAFIGLSLFLLNFTHYKTSFKISALMVLGIAAAALFGSFDLACLKGPYAHIDPRIVPIWLDHVKEAQPFYKAFEAQFSYIFYLATFSIVTFFVALITLMKLQNHNRNFYITFILFLVPFAVGFLQMRWFTFSSWLAVPLLVICIELLKNQYTKFENLPLILFGFTNPVLCTLLAVSFLMPPSVSHPKVDSSCTKKSNFVGLNQYPTGRIFAHEDFGPFILTTTKHSVVGAPYHRLGDAIYDTHTFFSLPPNEAFALAQKWQIDYVLQCKSEAPLKPAQPTSLHSALQNNHIPNWLEKITQNQNDDMLMYRVKKP